MTLGGASAMVARRWPKVARAEVLDLLDEPAHDFVEQRDLLVGEVRSPW